MSMTHKLIAETAKEMAACAYEECAKKNDFYKAYPSQKAFVSRHWKNFVGFARSTLASMLAMNHVDDSTKEQIADALFADRSLRPVGKKSKIIGHDGLIH